MKRTYSDFEISPKAIMTKNGVLWFDYPTGNLMAFDKIGYVRVATDKDAPAGSVIYLIPVEDKLSTTGFRIFKNELFYFVNLKKFFADASICELPGKDTISYKVESFMYERSKIWKLIKINYKEEAQAARASPISS